MSDTGMAPSIVNAIEAKPVKERSHERITKNNVMHAVRLHRGNDGHVRQLCGPRINSVISRPKINEVLHALDSRRRDVHGPVRIVRPDLDYKKNMTWGGSSWGSMARDQACFDFKQQLKSCQLIDMHQRRKHEIKEDHARDKVLPNFRTPPRYVTIGVLSFQIN